MLYFEKYPIMLLCKFSIMLLQNCCSHACACLISLFHLINLYVYFILIGFFLLCLCFLSFFPFIYALYQNPHVCLEFLQMQQNIQAWLPNCMNLNCTNSKEGSWLSIGFCFVAGSLFCLKLLYHQEALRVERLSYACGSGMLCWLE